MVDRPRSRQYTIQSHGDTLRISIPIPKIRFALLAWGGMAVISFCMVASGEPPYVALFGIFGLLLIVWNFLREQVVEVSDQHITICDDILGIRLRPKYYSAENIKDLRISATTWNGLVAFDYGPVTVNFGKGLDASGAGEIVSQIQRRFPHYQHDNSYARAQPSDAFDKVSIPVPGLSRDIEVPRPHHRSEVFGNKLRITIPSLKNWFAIIFLVIWLTVWSFFGILFMSLVISGKYELFLIVWLFFWFVAEIFSIYHLLWQLFGQEKIEVATDSITICQAILGIGRPKQYARQHISRLRADVSGSVKPYGLADEGISLSKGTGLIAFHYEDKTIRLGIGIDEAEAKYLVAEIQQLYPEYIDRHS